MQIAVDYRWYFFLSNYQQGFITKYLLHTYMHKYISLLIKQFLEFLFFNDGFKRHLISISCTKALDVLSSSLMVQLLQNTCTFQFSISEMLVEPIFSSFVVYACIAVHAVSSIKGHRPFRFFPSFLHQLGNFFSKNVPIVNFAGIVQNHSFGVYIQILNFQISNILMMYFLMRRNSIFLPSVKRSSTFILGIFLSNFRGFSIFLDN